MRCPRQLHQNRILNTVGWRAASTATTVMSRSRSQGTEVTIVTGAFPFELSRDITENSPVMGTIFNPAVREATKPVSYTHSADRIRTYILPTNSDAVRRAHS